MVTRATAARHWLDERLNGPAPVGLPWPSLLAFVRLVTNPRIFARPEPVGEAWRQVEEWLDCPTTWIPAPTARHREVLGRLLQGESLRANLIPDAHLAAAQMSTRNVAQRSRTPETPLGNRAAGRSIDKGSFFFARFTTCKKEKNGDKEEKGKG